MSVWGEPVPAGVLTSTAQLNPPPEPLGVFDVLPDRVPEGWATDGRTTALALSVALSNRRGVPVPWPLVSRAVTEARNAGLITVDTEGVSWPCSSFESDKVHLIISTNPPPPRTPPPGGRLRTERVLKPAQIQNFAEIVGELVQTLQPLSPAIHVAVEIDTRNQGLDAGTEAKVNALLTMVDGSWKVDAKGRT